ncbi:hypothetical protein EMIHUDRAFT_246965 [Emiliania huxleyi CCMP1516]|uniref:Uncharacterized protein n=2 Tax=Emiliania huxleyi TaxID=2903 RepID=A0A0D3IPY4_EMIH1|nr:hypothetical protein EMIHUDRAFT_246965 [Emiliania huxleyi CCMP1516]EOD13319.1 hypothetical protein EMIHUDRAFT_246965 [Emiliania huxleyi CCMP1516]|eukprot:XP_005765748.1 hypothetical protein EMIHUDRAFT_246965 [Emiliania huxleyi CCMP1516]
MAQITWPTEVAAPRYVLHLFLQHDKHCVAIARVAAAADGLGHRCLRPKPGGPPASSADAPPAAADPDAATGGDGDGDEATDEEGPDCEIVDDGAPGVPRIPEVLCPYPPGHRMAAARETVARRYHISSPGIKYDYEWLRRWADEPRLLASINTIRLRRPPKCARREYYHMYGSWPWIQSAFKKYITGDTVAAGTLPAAHNFSLADFLGFVHASSVGGSGPPVAHAGELGGQAAKLAVLGEAHRVPGHRAAHSGSVQNRKTY